jgi:hypothetical protein
MRTAARAPLTTTMRAAIAISGDRILEPGISFSELLRTPAADY